MHPFYGANARLLGGDRGSQAAGLVSMAAYLAFWAAVVAVGIKILNERFPIRDAPAPSPDDAMAILRRRYAMGEIDRSQFLQLRSDLGGDVRPAGSPDGLGQP